MFVFRESCDIPLLDYVNYEAQIIQSLETVQQETGVKTIWLKDLLCDHEKCKSKLDGTYIYRDGGHLSISGSEVLLGGLALIKDS